MSAPAFDLGIATTLGLDQMRFTAYHEAGHLAVSEGCGIPVKSLEISKSWFSGGTSGVTRMDLDAVAQPHPFIKDARMLTDAQIHGYLLTCLAGMRSVRLWFWATYGHFGPVEGVAFSDGGCGDEDNYRRVNRVVRISRSRAEAECDRILQVHWGRIVRAAEAVYQRGKIRGDRVPQDVPAQAPQLA